MHFIVCALATLTTLTPSDYLLHEKLSASSVSVKTYCTVQSEAAYIVSVYMKSYTAFSSSHVSLSDHDCLWLDYIVISILSEIERMLPISPLYIYLLAHITTVV